MAFAFLNPDSFPKFIKKIILNVKSYFVFIKKFITQIPGFKEDIQKDRTVKALKWKNKLRQRQLAKIQFLETHKKTKEKNKNIIKKLNKALEQEHIMAVNMDAQWIKSQEDNLLFIEKIKYLLSDSDKIKFILPAVEEIFKNYAIKENSEYNAYLEINKKKTTNLIAHLINNYFDNFRIDNKTKEKFLKYLVTVSEILAGNKIHEKTFFHPLWESYTVNMVPLQARTIIEKISSYSLLSMTIFYAHLAVNAEKPGGALEALGYGITNTPDKIIESFLKQRIRADIPFIKMDMQNLDIDKIKKYLKFEKEMAEQVQKTTFFNFSEQEKNKAKKIISQINPSLRLPLYANFEEEILKDQIFYWLASLGLKDKKNYIKIFGIMDKIYPKIKAFYEEPSLKDLLQDNYQLKLRYLNSLNSSLLLKEELERQKVNLFRGILIYWTNFIWENRLSEEEINIFFKVLSYIRNNSDYMSIFGKPYPFAGAAFYMSTLSFWGQWAVNKYAKSSLEENAFMDSIKKTIDKKFSLMKFIYSLENYKNIYQDIDLSRLDILQTYGKEKTQIYISTLSFFSDWSQLNNLDKDYIQKHFEIFNALLYSKLKEKLTNFYSLININIDLNPFNKTIRVKNHIFGIYSSWANYFQLRGYDTEESITKAFNQIIYIAKLSSDCKLGYNQNQIKYWFHRKIQKGYTDKDLENIFKNISKLQNLIKDSYKEASNKIKNTDFFYWEKKHILDKISQTCPVYMFPGEQQRLAEELMLQQKVTYKELLEDYSEGIIIDTVNAVHCGWQLTPAEIHKYNVLFKSQGYSLNDILNFLNLKFLILDEEKKFSVSLKDLSYMYPKLSDGEINGFLTYVFSKWDLPYQKKVLRCLKLMHTLQNYFYAEHNYYIDPRKALNAVSARNFSYKAWQIKLLVKKGNLNKESINPLIVNLGSKMNLYRFLLNTTSEEYRVFSNEKILDLLQDTFYCPYWYSTRDKIADTLIQLNIITETLVTNFISLKKNYPKNIEKIHEIYHTTENKIYELCGFLWNYNKSEQKNKNLVKRNEILNKQKKYGKKTIVLNHTMPVIENKETLKNFSDTLYNSALLAYGIKLPPNQISALLWKIREGYTIKDTLKIYVKDKKTISAYYKKTFEKNILSSADDNIIIYLAEQVNFYPVTIKQLKKIFDFAKIIHHQYKLFFNEDIDIEKTLIAAHKTYYSGASPELIKEMFKLSAEAFSFFDKSQIKNVFLFKHKLINLFSVILNIEMFEEDFDKIYSDKIYEEILKSVLRKKEFPYFFTSENSVKYIINGLKETNQSPFDFQMLNLKTNSLYSILKNKGHSHKLYNLLIFSDIYYQSFANRLYLINLIPEEITKNKYYYWQTISQSISNSAFNAREKIMAEKIKKKMADLENISYVKNIILKPDIETIAKSLSIILISVVFYLAVSAILLILIIKLFF